MKKDSIKPGFSWKTVGFSLLRYWWVAALAAALVAVAFTVRTVSQHPPVRLEVHRSTRIDVTAEEVRSIRDVGEWEFLNITTEEMVEWSRSRTLGTDRLVRIYTGTLRIGVDLKKASDDWFTSKPDSVAELHLPKVALLDPNFIDEARTRSFYEKGSYPPEALQSLYEQARQRMLRRCLTPQNLKQAEVNARSQFTHLFQGLGFKRVDIHFDR